LLEYNVALYCLTLEYNVTLYSFDPRRDPVGDPRSNTPHDDEPTAEELAAIERESGLIAAEMALLDAEIRMLATEDEASEVDWQRLRRAMRDVVRENAELLRDQLDDDPESSEGEAA
jgi:Family of unknown function (DUF6284)